MSKESLRAIREYCLECAGDRESVKTCNPFPKHCPLWKFRLGTDPDIAPRNITDERRKELSEAMGKISRKS